MKEADIVVLGGSAAGFTAAITARRHHPDRKIILVRKEELVPIPCGIPYVLGTVKDIRKNVIPDAGLEKHDVELVKSEALAIDREKQTLQTVDGDIRYERLILATGSLPSKPPIPGIEKERVFTIHKNLDYIANLKSTVTACKNVVIVGGGFIGIEFADEIKKTGVENVTIVEIAPHCLSLAYDDEFCKEMEEHLRARGIQIRTSCKVESIAGDDAVDTVRLDNGDSIPADAVVIGIGAEANVTLAEDAGLRIGRTRSIVVDKTMRTSDDRIFACGDCAKKFAFFSGRPSLLKLASIATTEARIAAANLFGITRENRGTVGVWSTAVGSLAMGTAGLTESMAIDQGYKIVSSSIEGPNRHPGVMPGAAMTKIKLVFERQTGLILGGQVRGDATAGEIINTISACIERRMTAEDIAMFQTGTHPMLTASPVAYPLVNAAETAISKMNSGKY